MMKPITILSTACDGMFMPGFFRCLRENGERQVRIIGADMAAQPFMGGMIDGFCRVPSYSDPRYIDILLDICKRERVDIFFPHISMELPLVLDRLADFRALGVKVAITDSQTLNIANDKLQLYEHMRAHGLPTPEYYKIESGADLRACAPRLGYPERPVVVKLTRSSGSRGVRIVRAAIPRAESFLHSKPGSFDITLDEMCRTLDECDPLPTTIAMEYLPGCEYTVDLLADHGRVLCIAGRRNYESRASIAMATYTEEKRSAYDLCRRIVELLRLDGNIGFDFMLTDRDEPVLTDLNPRITATIVLYHRAGINFPYLRCKQLLGEPFPHPTAAYGIRMKRKYLDLFE